MDEYTFKQLRLVNFLRLEAQKFYDSNYQPKPGIVENLRRVNLPEGLRSYVSEQFLGSVSEWLQNNHVVECAEYKKATTANVLAAWTDNGKICAIRIPHSFGDPEYHNRIDHPAVLHPLKDEEKKPVVFSYHDGSNIEVLPFVHIVYIENGIDILTGIHQIAGLRYTLDKANSPEFAIMPNGAALPSDPDLVKVGQAPMSFEMNRAIQKHVLTNFPSLKPLAWIEGDQSIQEIFFPPGYLSTPLVPRSNPAVKESAKPANG